MNHACCHDCIGMWASSVHPQPVKSGVYQLQDFNTLAIGRALTGLAIGLSSALVPTYISEVRAQAARVRVPYTA